MVSLHFLIWLWFVALTPARSIEQCDEDRAKTLFGVVQKLVAASDGPAALRRLEELHESCDIEHLRAAQILESSWELEGDIHRDLRHFQEAKAAYQRAFDSLESRSSTREPSISGRARLLDKIGRASFAQHRIGRSRNLDEAVAVYQRARALLEDGGQDDTVLYAQVLVDLARARRRIDDFDPRVFADLERAVEEILVPLHRARGADEEVARVLADALSHYAGIAYRVFDHERVSRLYRRALRIRREIGDQAAVARSLRSIATYQYNIDALDAARTSLEESDSILDALGTPATHTDRLSNAQVLTAVLLDQGQLHGAEASQRRVLAGFIELKGPQSHVVAGKRFSLATILHARGRCEEGLAEAEASLAVLEAKLPGHVVLRGARAAALKNSWCLGDLGATKRHVEHLLRRDDDRLPSQIRSGDEDLRLRYLRRQADTLSQVLTLRREFADRPESLDRFAVAAVIRHKGRLLDALAVRRLNDPGGPECARLAQDHAAIVDALTRAHVTEASPLEQGRRRRALRQSETSLSTSCDAPVSPEDSKDTVERLQATLPPDTALVELVQYRPYDARTPGLAPRRRFGSPQYAAYVMTDASIEWVELGDARSIDALAGRFHAALSTRGEVVELGRTLDERLMRPLRAVLGHRTRLLLSPDGALLFVPFSALVDEHGDYLVERYTITTLESGRDRLRLSTVDSSTASPAIFAAPAPGPAPSSPDGTARPPYLCGEYCELPGTANEATALSALFPRATIVLGDAATETRFKQLSARSIIHVASHATAGDRLGTCHADPSWRPSATPQRCERGIRVSPELAPRARPAPHEPSVAEPSVAEPPSSAWDLRGDSLLRTGLLFSGVNAGVSGLDDGFLSALEVSALDLVGTQLVVLSACDTGRGDPIDGQGVLGLRRAFAMAGVQTLVMTLWRIDDQATPALQAAFYENLRAGMGRTDALRQAQRATLRRATHAHPYYWAGFEISGVPDPLVLDPTLSTEPMPAPAPDWRWWLLISLALGGLLGVVWGRHRRRADPRRRVSDPRRSPAESPLVRRPRDP